MSHSAFLNALPIPDPVRVETFMDPVSLFLPLFSWLPKIRAIIGIVMFVDGGTDALSKYQIY